MSTKLSFVDYLDQLAQKEADEDQFWGLSKKRQANILHDFVKKRWEKPFGEVTNEELTAFMEEFSFTELWSDFVTSNNGNEPACKLGWFRGFLGQFM